jgi:hypothetical protein
MLLIYILIWAVCEIFLIYLLWMILQKINLDVYTFDICRMSEVKVIVIAITSWLMDYIIWMIIAIAAIASSLKGKQHREEWDVALN